MKNKLPTTDEAGVIAVNLVDNMKECDQAIFIAGFQECVKYLSSLENVETSNSINISVRWHDGYLEEFVATEVRFGSDLLWMRLTNGSNRHISLRSVRWFSTTPESHAIIPE